MMAEEVHNILEILGVNKCVMVGHSLGGYVSLAFASKHPSFLKGLVLLHSHAEDDNEEEKLFRDRTVEIVEKDKSSFIAQFTPSLFAPDNVEKHKKEIEWLKSIALENPKEGITAALKGMRNRANHLETVKKLKMPVLVIAGDQDSRIPLEKVKKQFAAIKTVKLEIIKNCGHMGFVEAGDTVFDLIRSLLQKVYKK